MRVVVAVVAPDDRTTRVIGIIRVVFAPGERQSVFAESGVGMIQLGQIKFVPGVVGV